MKMSVLLGIVVAVFLLGGCASTCNAEEKGKFAIILQAGAETNEGMARAIHALLYARELSEGGYKVVLIFDGAGTGWAKEMQNPDHSLHAHYMKIKELGLVEEICDYCSDAFEVKESLSDKQKKLLVGDYEGHPSLVKWIKQGYQIIVL